MDKKLLATLLLGSLVLGAGLAGMTSSFFWDQALKVQLAEKDRVIARLNQDLDDLTASLSTLKQTNAAMRALIDTSLRDAGEVARSNRSSVEKLRAVILRLEALQKAVAGP